MKTRTSCNRSGRVQRGAFTLVELMVVITIMAALVALTSSAVLKFIGVQQTSNTQSTLDRVQSQLARAWSKVKDDAKKAPMTEPPNAVGIQALGLPYSNEATVKDWIQKYLSGSDTNTTERTRVIYIKLKLKQAFPMSFNEAVNPAPFLPLPGYYNPIPPTQPSGYLGSLGISGSLPASAQAIESSACLLMALQRGVSGAGIDPSDLTSGGAAGSYPAPKGNLPYLTDAWGRPIFFTRAPAGNPYLNPVTPTSVANPYPTLPWSLQSGIPVTCYSQSGANDPGDPQGLLNTGLWGQTYGPRFFALTWQVIAKPNASNQPTSYKLAPMLASGGPSDWTKPGQNLPFDPITFFTVPGSDALFSTP